MKKYYKTTDDQLRMNELQIMIIKLTKINKCINHSTDVHARKNERIIAICNSKIHIAKLDKTHDPEKRNNAYLYLGESTNKTVIKTVLMVIK